MITLDELEELYRTRQSCRSFDRTRQVDDALLERVCKTALLAPSACNAQPWKLYVTTGEKAKELAACLQGMGMNKFVSDAPALVAVVESKGNLVSRVGGKLIDNEFTKNDLGILTAHLVLAAASAGLSSCILGWRNEEKIRAALSLKKDDRIPEVVALGYAEANYELRPKKRKDADETLFFLKR